MHPVHQWREAREQLRLNKIYQGLRCDSRPRYIFHGPQDPVGFRKKFRDRKTIAMFPPLSGNRRNGIKIPGLKTLYRPIMGASPATYFVKNGGNDSLDGLSDANAWEALSKAVGESYIAGDEIQFNRGDTWTEATTFYNASNGSEGSPITWKDYGTGNIPKFVYTGSGGAYLPLNSRSWLDFENLDLDGNGTGTCENICIINGSNNINFTNIAFHNTGTNGQIIYAETAAGSISNITFTNCDIYDNNGTTLGEGWYFKSISASYTISNVTLTESRIYDCLEGIHWAAAAGTTALANGTFTHNELYNLNYATHYNIVGLQGNATNTTFAYNYIHDCGQSEYFDYVFQLGAGAGGATNKIYYNIIDTIVITNSSDAAVFNITDVPGGWKIYNNSVYGITSSGAARNGIVLAGTTDYVEAKNNAFHDLVNHVRNTAGGSNNDFDYNCRYGGTQGDLIGAHDVTSDPLWLDAANGNFKLASNSPCIEAGTPIAGLTKDYYGIPLGRGTNPDMGASETLKGGPRIL